VNGVLSVFINLYPQKRILRHNLLHAIRRFLNKNVSLEVLISVIDSMKTHHLPICLGGEVPFFYYEFPLDTTKNNNSKKYMMKKVEDHEIRAEKLQKLEEDKRLNEKKKRDLQRTNTTTLESMTLPNNLQKMSIHQRDTKESSDKQ